jgi:hypothetical protein
MIKDLLTTSILFWFYSQQSKVLQHGNRFMRSRVQVPIIHIFATCNYSHLQKYIRWDSHSTCWWRQSPDGHAIEEMLEPDKNIVSSLLYYLGCMIGLTRGSFNMVSESEGIKFEPRPHIIPLRVIPTYRSLYSGVHVAQTSGLLSRATWPWLTCSMENIRT